MLKLAFIPLVLILSVLIILIGAYIVYRKVRRGIEFTLEKSSEFASEQQQKWEAKEKQKKQPEILQKGLKTYAELHDNINHLPKSWQSSLEPLSHIAKSILDEIEDEVILEASESTGVHSPKKLNTVRPFFNHSLKALLQLTQKIRTDYKAMDAEDTEKARQNITVIKADLLRHQRTLHKGRKMDFDVAMDVIKARLKK
jgi:ABC-type nickel/cobalt efflux system permease component RcnA